MQESLDGMAYINLFGVLELDDYYFTDAHWRQERLGNVVQALAEGLHAETSFDIKDYQVKSYDPFYGVYYGQSARSIQPDTLCWLENDTTRSATVEKLRANGTFEQGVAMYNEAALGGMDSYEIFLHGMEPLIKLTNPNNENGRSLIIFRDSYGSPLAPLLLESYQEIILVDLRYLNVSLLDSYIDFDQQDVLFLYSTTIINTNDSMQVPLP